MKLALTITNGLLASIPALGAVAIDQQTLIPLGAAFGCIIAVVRLTHIWDKRMSKLEMLVKEMRVLKATVENCGECQKNKPKVVFLESEIE